MEAQLKSHALSNENIDRVDLCTIKCRRQLYNDACSRVIEQALKTQPNYQKGPVYFHTKPNMH